MLKYHKNVEDHRFPHFQHHRKERKITMKKRCLSLLLTLCLLAALAVPAGRAGRSCLRAGSGKAADTAARLGASVRSSEYPGR